MSSLVGGSAPSFLHFNTCPSRNAIPSFGTRTKDLRPERREEMSVSKSAPARLSGHLPTWPLPCGPGAEL